MGGGYNISKHFSISGNELVFLPEDETQILSRGKCQLNYSKVSSGGHDLALIYIRRALQVDDSLSECTIKDKHSYRGETFTYLWREGVDSKAGVVKVFYGYQKEV